MTETMKSRSLARLQALEAVAEAVARFRDGGFTMRDRDALVAAHNALCRIPDDSAPAEMVEVAVWEYPDGEIRQARAGSNMDRHYQAVTPWTRLGIVRLLLVKGDEA